MGRDRVRWGRGGGALRTLRELGLPGAAFGRLSTATLERPNMGAPSKTVVSSRVWPTATGNPPADLDRQPLHRIAGSAARVCFSLGRVWDG